MSSYVNTAIAECVAELLDDVSGWHRNSGGSRFRRRRLARGATLWVVLITGLRLEPGIAPFHRHGHRRCSLVVIV